MRNEDNHYGIGWIIIFAIIFYFFFGNNEYEGLSAEEWADEYYALANCVYSAENPKSCL